MNKNVLYLLLGILTLALAANSIAAHRTLQRMDKGKSGIIRPTSKDVPTSIRDAYTWPAISICDDKSGYTLYYQLDDGTNVYIDGKGAFVRGKKVKCTN